MITHFKGLHFCTAIQSVCRLSHIDIEPRYKKTTEFLHTYFCTLLDCSHEPCKTYKNSVPLYLKASNRLNKNQLDYKLQVRYLDFL